jgi:hypothetical protein
MWETWNMSKWDNSKIKESEETPYMEKENELGCGEKRVG